MGFLAAVLLLALIHFIPWFKEYRNHLKILWLIKIFVVFAGGYLNHQLSPERTRIPYLAQGYRLDGVL